MTLIVISAIIAIVAIAIAVVPAVVLLRQAAKAEAELASISALRTGPSVIAASRAA